MTPPLSLSRPQRSTYILPELILCEPRSTNSSASAGEQIEFNVSFREPLVNRKPENLLLSSPPNEESILTRTLLISIALLPLLRTSSNKYFQSGTDIFKEIYNYSGNHNNRPIDLFSNTTATRSFPFRSLSLSYSIFPYALCPKRYPNFFRIFTHRNWQQNRRESRLKRKKNRLSVEQV